MISRLFELVTSISGCSVAAAALIAIIKLSRPSKLDGIPTVGSSSWLGSFMAGLKFLTNANEVIQEGYEKHKSAPFKVAEPHSWIVVLSSRKHLEEMRRASDDMLSPHEAAINQLQVEYTMGRQICYDHYHVPIVRSQLTRNIKALYSELRDEMITAFGDVLDLRDNEWKSVPVFNSMQKIVSRVSNRVLVGLPLCRHPDWINLSIRYTFDVANGGAIIRLFPDMLKPIAARLFTNLKQNNQLGKKLLGPIIEERRKCLDEHGNEWANKPNDFLSWLMDEAEGPESTVESLVTRVFLLNFAAILASSVSITNALFYLAANPQCIKPLREEVEAIVEKEGWSKAAVGKMRKVDSFMKECQRLEGMASVGMRRATSRDFTFSDGTFIRKGTTVLVAMRSIHHDEAFYGDAHEFEPFRFADLREEDGESMKHQFTSTTYEYFPFGYGRHACPGRFFAAIELKSMLAHIVGTCDIKLADNTTRPQSLHFGTAMVPDSRAKVMFRRRVYD